MSRRSRSALAALALLAAVWPAAAHAGPAVAAVSAWFATLGPLATAAVQLAAGVALQYAVAALQGRPRAGAAARELARPDSLPAYRYVYGRRRIYGSPAPYRVKGDFLYACYILNSRPSSGNFSIIVDKRPLTLSGNVHDFATGAVATAPALLGGGHLTAWIGRGEQTSPPAMILAEAGDIFEATDGWQGLTVLWLRLGCGGAGKRSQRWPRVPPEVEVEGDWSLVWDPREPGQDPDDPATWGWSESPWLCALDALRTNPVRQYGLGSLMTETFAAAADIDEEAVPLKGGGTEARYRCAGTLVWDDRELEDQIAPLVAASAGRLTRVGGRLAAVPGAAQVSEIVITDLLDDDGLAYEVLRRGRDVATSVRVAYVDPDRDWREADAGVYQVPGAIAADGKETVDEVTLEMVTSPTQAQRIGKITAEVQREQRQLTVVLPPVAFDAVAGGLVTLALPAPYSAFNGDWVIERMTPGLDPVGEDGVALRCPAVLSRYTPAAFAWNPVTDERDVLAVAVFDGARPDLAAPGAIGTLTGADAALGTVPRIRFAFAPAATGRAASYEWQYRLSGGSWQDGGEIDGEIRDGLGKVFGYVAPALPGSTYDIRVRTLGTDGGTSAWVTATGIAAAGPAVDLDAPTNGSATAGAGKITLSWRTPNKPDAAGLQVWVNTTNNSGTATLLATIYAAPSATVGYEHTGLGSGTTRHYWAKTLGPYGSTSGFSARVFATTT